MYDPAQNRSRSQSRSRPTNAAPQALPAGPGELRQYTNIPNEGPLPDALARQLKHAYYASISYTDAQIGKVLEELEAQRLTQNTIVVLWGDHGWKLGEHGAWAKHTNFENDTNAPLIFSAPGLKTAGQHARGLVEFVDIFPTLSELAGLPLPKHLEGQSLAPLLANPSRPGKSAAFSQYPRGQRFMGYSMRTDRYRLTVGSTARIIPWWTTSNSTTTKLTPRRTPTLLGTRAMSNSLPHSWPNGKWVGPRLLYGEDCPR